MELNKFSGKDYNETLKLALETLNVSESDVIIYSEEKKGGLFKGNIFELVVTPLKDIVEYVKGYLSEMLRAMGIEVTYETQIREGQIKIKMYSDDNPILIGKSGRTLRSLETLCRLSVKVKYGKTPYISLDVENYKDKQLMHIERTARRVAREVKNSGIAVEMDSMNSYERLIVHKALADYKDVYTESIGEEPNRRVVVKPKN